jgi:hypothetical protein
MIFEQLQVVQKWFVGDIDNVNEFGTPYLGRSGELIDKNYATILDVPSDVLEIPTVLLFKAFQIELNGIRVVFSNKEDIENLKVFFLTEDAAKEYIQELINSDEFYAYWDNDSERTALRDLGHELADDEDFSELSINLDRRWNEFLQAWHLREFGGLGYIVHYNEQTFEF